MTTAQARRVLALAEKQLSARRQGASSGQQVEQRNDEDAVRSLRQAINAGAFNHDEEGK